MIRSEMKWLILWFEVDFFEYDEVVSYSLSLDSPNCHTQSQLAMQQVIKFTQIPFCFWLIFVILCVVCCVLCMKVGQLALDPKNWPSLEKQFNTCTPITDAVLFVDTVYNPIAFSVQVILFEEIHFMYQMRECLIFVFLFDWYFLSFRFCVWYGSIMKHILDIRVWVCVKQWPTHPTHLWRILL